MPKCDVSFANDELHQARGHVTPTMISTWPKCGHRLLTCCKLPRLSSYRHTVGLLPYADRFLELTSCYSVALAGPINDVNLFATWLLWPTCLFLLPNLSNLPVWVFCCWWIPLLFCSLLVFSINSACFSDVSFVARNYAFTCLANCTFILGMDCLVWFHGCVYSVFSEYTLAKRPIFACFGWVMKVLSHSIQLWWTFILERIRVKT